MSRVALYVPLEAKPGKEKEVADFLKSALPLVNAEPSTVSWFAIQEGPSSFAIFDTFDNEAGREAHLNGKVAAALMAKAGELLPSRRRSTRSISWPTSCQNKSRDWPGGSGGWLTGLKFCLKHGGVRSHMRTGLA
jgi:quinol monooxygenase YgiN